jgi:hypothetical protein
MIQLVRNKEKCRNLLIWLLKRKKKKRRKYVDKNDRFDPDDKLWKLGD